MKRIFFVLVAVVAMQTAFAQEKGLHLTLGGGLGWTNFAYELEGGSNKGRLGYGGTLGAQYFFNMNWGISLAAEIYVFNTQSRYNGNLNTAPVKADFEVTSENNRGFMFPGQIDDEGDKYDFYLHLRNWKENQKTTFFEIPLMLMYQKKYGRLERRGLYFGLGPKLQIPISSTFERYKGDVVTYGFYEIFRGQESNHWFGKNGESSDMPHHAFGTNPKRNWTGDNTLKTGVSIVGEFGFLFSLGRSGRVDLSLGVVADYGLMNISNEKKELLGPVSGVTQQDADVVAGNVFYNGILNSDQTQHINPWSIRGKVGLRVKLGKLKERPIDDGNDGNEGYERPQRPPDTIFVYPIVVYTDPEPVKRPDGPTKPYYNDTISEEDEGYLLEPIYFDLDKFSLTAKSIEVLNRKVELMKKYPHAVLTVVGHTCDIGKLEYNETLSANRAEAARMYLIQKGISPMRVITIPMGKRNPSVQNTSEANRALNRRVDFYLAH